MHISDLGVPVAARWRADRVVYPLSAALPGVGGTGRLQGTGRLHGVAGPRGLGWQAAGAAGFTRLQKPSVPAAVTKPGTTNIRKQYMPMTRVIAAGGNDATPGPHPPRETA